MGVCEIDGYSITYSITGGGTFVSCLIGAVVSLGVYSFLT
jgi:hypothetical protein